MENFINGFSGILILIAVKDLRACNSATERQIAKSKLSGSSLKHGESTDSNISILNFSRTRHVFSFSVTYIDDKTILEKKIYCTNITDNTSPIALLVTSYSTYGIADAVAFGALVSSCSFTFTYTTLQT